MTPADVGSELAALHFYLARAEQRDDDWATVMTAVPVSPAALEGSAVDDARIALGDPCPDCRALPGEPCHVDCSSRWDDGAQP